MNSAIKKPRKNRSVDLSKYTPQYQEVHGMAVTLGISIGALCKLADVPLHAVNNWRYRYNPFIAHASRLDQLRAAVPAELKKRRDQELAETREKLALLESKEAAYQEFHQKIASK